MFNDENGVNYVPRVAVELAGLVHAEDEVHLLARPERLVQDPLVVPLGRPQALLHTQVQVELSQHPSVKINRKRPRDGRTYLRQRFENEVPLREVRSEDA